MDLKKLTPGEMVIAISGVVLLIFSFFKWYGVEFKIAGQTIASASRNGWESPDAFFSIIAILIGVVMAAHNYPDSPRKGDAITGIPAETDDSVTFHAGTTLKDGTLLTSGGRVLCVVGLADTVKAAQRAAYAAVEQIRFDGMQYRTDIGYRAIKR